jgi:hypothetical protein
VKRLWAAVAVLVAVTAARIALVESLHDQGYFAKYLIFADRILAGEIPRDRLLDLSPLYLWCTVAFRAIGAGFHAIRALQIALVSVAAFFAGLAARRWGAIAASAAAVFILTSRGALVCATELEPETFILLFNSAALAAVMNGAPLTAGVLLGLSATCRPNALLAALLLAIVLRSWRVIAGALIPVILVLGVNIALTGEVALMDPGTVFYEGMNPNATGYEGVQPRIVNDLERTSREPDYLHVAYRVVAAGVVGHPVTRAESNRYWTSKALAFMRDYPRAAMILTVRKLYFAIHSYEAYDLVTMARKDFELSRWPVFLPFAVMVGLWSAGVLSRRSAGVSPVWAFLLATLLPMVIFYVTARQRNAMLPAAAVLAAIGLVEILQREKFLPAIGAAVIAILLSINGNAQREDFAGWFGWRNLFDQAIALESSGRWMEADVMLQDLQGYEPMRENRAVSSVAYYRARAAIHLGRNPRALLAQAEHEAPGNEHVLALLAVNGDKRAERRLFELHDPFTARRALLEAQ